MKAIVEKILKDKNARNKSMLNTLMVASVVSFNPWA